jgi:hypothetical protein
MGKGQDYTDLPDLISLDNGSPIMNGVSRPENAHNHFLGNPPLPGNATLNFFFQILFTLKDQQCAGFALCHFINALDNDFDGGDDGFGSKFP